MSQVWETSPYTHTMLLLHIAMADAANDEGEFHYKQETLAKKARVSERYLRDVTKQMVEDGFLETKKMRWGRLTYRLLTPQDRNPVPVPPEPSSGNSGTQFRSHRNPVPVTTEPSTEPSVEPSDRTTNIDPSGAEEKLEGHMPVYGSLDESAEMPENGKAVKPEKKFDPAPKAGTHPWLIYRFGQEQRQHNCGRGFTKGILHKAFKELRDDGYSNEDIEVMVRAFFSQNEQDIRAKMADIDVAVMFRTRMHSLKTKARGAIKAEKTGSRELSRNINRRIKEQLNG